MSHYIKIDYQLNVDLIESQSIWFKVNEVKVYFVMVRLKNIRLVKDGWKKMFPS